MRINTSKDLSVEIKDLRRKYGLSQERLVAVLGQVGFAATVSAVRRWERGTSPMQAAMAESALKRARAVLGREKAALASGEVDEHGHAKPSTKRVYDGPAVQARKSNQFRLSYCTSSREPIAERDIPPNDQIPLGTIYWELREYDDHAEYHEVQQNGHGLLATGLILTADEWQNWSGEI